MLKASKLLSRGGTFISQAGSTTFWRNDTLKRAVHRFQSCFATSCFFEMEEHDWAWMVGSNNSIHDPAQKMIQALERMPVRPRFIDATSIRKATVLPLTIRKELEGITI